ncbi:MAG: response regulator, partial [Planctomycetota bacterium]
LRLAANRRIPENSMEDKKDIRVLYIEDNEGHARLFVKGLKREGGFCVDRVAEPEAGLKMANGLKTGASYLKISIAE